MGKTRKAFCKRFKLTRKNKILHRPAGLSHGLVKKRLSKKRQKLFKQTRETVLPYSEYHR